PLTQPDTLQDSNRRRPRFTLFPYTTLFRSRFGNGSYTKAFLGQSSIRLTLDPVSVGFSTENLWWGPGLHNSITMSNTAAGFAYVTLNTSKPIKTYIGSFEFQIVGGHLEKSGYPSSLLGDTATHQRYAVKKPEGWRYFSGI